MEIICSDLEFSYGDKLLFQRLNLEVQEKERIWIKGKSGSGKSSLLKLICGLLQPQSGEIKINKQNISNLNLVDRNSFRLNHIGYLHQENHLIEHWTVLQNLLLVESSIKDIQKIILQLGLDVDVLNKLVFQLSGGEKQRISLARLFLQKPVVALIDEPTSHLDDENTELVINLIDEKLANSTVVIVSHDNRFSGSKFKQILFRDLIK